MTAGAPPAPTLALPVEAAVDHLPWAQMWAGAAAAVAEVEDHFATSRVGAPLKAGGAWRRECHRPAVVGRRQEQRPHELDLSERFHYQRSPGGRGGKRFRRSWHYCSLLSISWLESPQDTSGTTFAVCLRSTSLGMRQGASGSRE